MSQFYYTVSKLMSKAALQAISAYVSPKSYLQVVQRGPSHHPHLNFIYSENPVAVSGRYRVLFKK